MKKLLVLVSFFILASLAVNAQTSKLKEGVVIEVTETTFNRGIKWSDASGHFDGWDGNAISEKVNVDHNPGVAAKYVVIRTSAGELIKGYVLGMVEAGEKVKVDQQKLDSILNLIR